MNHLPNFFIVGMPRSGTTSMYTYLKQHPDIHLALYKEPDYFDFDLTRSQYSVCDARLYQSLFADAGDCRAVGEGSVWYMTSRVAAGEIHKAVPDAKIIIMLRDPVDMIYSLHSLYTRTGNEDEPDFGKALALESQREAGLKLPGGAYFPEGLGYTRVASYYDKIKRFIDVFGGHRVHMVIFDDFARDTAASYRGVLEFLEVDPGFVPEFDLKKAGQLLRPVAMEQIRRAPADIRKKLAAKTGLRAHRGPRRVPLSPELETDLRRRFKEDLRKTEDLIGKDLSGWYET